MMHASLRRDATHGPHAVAPNRVNHRRLATKVARFGRLPGAE